MGKHLQIKEDLIMLNVFSNFFSKPKLNPVELEIKTVNQLSGSCRITFETRFRIAYLFSRSWYFQTIGTFETTESIDKATLLQILETTDQHRFIYLNMKERDRGDFDYNYRYKDNWLTINYTTF